MASERNNPALEFETMLRRHLKSGGAPVAACAGFDFDAASAYLENALGGSQRAGYESHLAGCATCRRHLIELSRLAQTAPHVGTQPVTVADQTPAWVRWREVVAGWFDLSAWNLKWQLVGAAGAAFAILIAALGVQSWRQASQHGVATNAFVANQAQTAEVDQMASSAAPTPESSSASSQNAQLLASGNSVAGQSGQLRIPVPTPLVGPKDSEPAVAVAPPSESLSFTSSQMSGALPPNSRPDVPAETQRSNGAGQQRQGSQSGAPTPVADNMGNAKNLSQSNLGGLGQKGQATDSPVQASRITPSFGINPANPRPAPTPHSKPQTEKSSAPVKGLPKFAMRLIPGIKSDPKSELERKVKTDASDDESSKRLIDYIRDKVFRFEDGMWIDQAYKPEMQEWRVWNLTRGSKEYEQVLAKEPLLKEFFVRAPIIVVWNNKIYKVR